MGQFDKIHSLISEAAAGVIDQVLQSTTEPVFDQIDFQSEIMVRIDFRSKFAGKFWFIFDKPFCYEIATGFSGMSREELDDDMLLDTVKEICNMMSSSILLKFDSKGNFKATVPEVFTGDQVLDQVFQLPDTAHYFCFKVGDKVFKIILFLTY
ncbi:MAG: hypothetical protein A2X42_03810 [Candidatus Margulisbacteria bacterium GWF2_38_17]|nr:MAG: hypothetical protein A2X43_06675 [Candidatus Margulisbacteria bacterium GWD2_39_127]OGI05296.1 MAG: hypothetical protein A2X42_03810 [Candidatus Margulisbacteria bacterium GWF2_38_17]OGI10845.1 MAG: hypothetical protein A2X41_05665 [Candidatus Margulisbacteria bacterium GWE2_39_32]